jgi:hypothetical protein
MWLGDNSNSEGLSYMSARWGRPVSSFGMAIAGKGGGPKHVRSGRGREHNAHPPSSCSYQSSAKRLGAVAPRSRSGKFMRAGLSIARAFPRRARLTSVPIRRPLPGRSPSGRHTAAPHHSPALASPELNDDALTWTRREQLLTHCLR